ncbi:MAG: ABC transporter ATP-binding protein [Eubacteriales bacterium]|nr:ABC transporter ATP-binding protein [Eubacteriales bacterium]
MEEKKLIQFRNIVMNFDDNQLVLKGINLDINENEFVTLLGPSGCGKTTLLRILGGFLEPTEGTVIFDGEDITKLPPHKRELNTVFQKYALFPHMNVYQNIAFGLKIKKMSADVIEQKVMKMLKLIGLEGYENKNVTLLSGGQQQRVAIARALVNEPKVLLLDEPLGALDLKLRKEMQYELKRIQQEVGITFIFVTHDQEEALTMSDKIVIMKDGEIQQIGTPQDIYNEPINRYVADFVGESNIISGRMPEDYKVVFDDTTFECVDHDFDPNEPVDIIIRPEDIDIVKPGEGKLTGEVLSVLFKGMHYEVVVETVPGTSVTVNMRVIKNNEVTSGDGKEKISANDFFVDIEDVKLLDDKEIIARADAQAWLPDKDEYISINKIEYDIKEEIGEYPVTFFTSSGTMIQKSIYVVNQPFVKNVKANEAVSAFNFFKTVDELRESVALDTDLKTWANAQGWKISDENESVDISVDYDFDPDEIKEGVYKVTFWTTGREFKIRTTDYVEEGIEVGLDFFPEDIHVMKKMEG